MVGLGILIRIGKLLLGKSLAKTGALPTRFYLHETLRSLDHDNIGDAVKLLKISKGALVDRSRWKLVRQLVLFRCRVLREGHRKRIRYIESRIEEHMRYRRFPWRWFRKRPVEKLTQYKKTLALEKDAQALLEEYESQLKSI